MWQVTGRKANVRYSSALLAHTSSGEEFHLNRGGRCFHGSTQQHTQNARRRQRKGVQCHLGRGRKGRSPGEEYGSAELKEGEPRSHRRACVTCTKRKDEVQQHLPVTGWLCPRVLCIVLLTVKCVDSFL